MFIAFILAFRDNLFQSQQASVVIRKLLYSFLNIYYGCLDGVTFPVYHFSFLPLTCTPERSVS